MMIRMSRVNDFDIDRVLEQLEDYGKYKGILRCEGEGFENYIPVSVAKLIVKERGLGGVLGYVEENLCEEDLYRNTFEKGI